MILMIIWILDIHLLGFYYAQPCIGDMSHKRFPFPSFQSLDVILETPVVVIPESLNSPDVLVAHLGQITVANALPPQSVNQEAFLSFPPSK